MNLTDLTKEVKTGKGSETAAKFIDDVYEYCKKHYLKQQRDWYTNERFVRWDHWIVFNKTLNQIQRVPASEWEVRRTVNKIRTQVRWVKNFIKRNQPRWQVAPSSGSQESLDEAIKYNKLLQDFYEKKRMKSLLTEVIVNALKYSVWVMEIGFVKKEGKNVIDAWVHDTFDIFIDPEATCIEDARFVLKAVKKSITTIKANKNYKFDGTITPDGREGASDYKDKLEKERYNKVGQESSLKDFESIILKELWIKTVDDQGNTVVKVITSGAGQVMRERSTPYKRLPFFIYNPEKEPGSVYSDPWIKDLISLNKSLDKMASQIETYTQRMLGGKWLIKRGVEVSTITDKGAEFVSYKGNVPPTHHTIQPLPAAPMMYMNSLEKWIEEFGGMREASLGRAPGSMQSGKGIEALQSSDASTVAEPIENLEIFLADIWEFLLQLVSDTVIVPETTVIGNEEIKYVGKSSTLPNNDALVIEGRKVKVVIVPELAYTEDAKKEIVFRLSEAGMIDQQTLLEYLNVSNIQDIIERVKLNKQEGFKEEIVKQNAAHATGDSQVDDSAGMADQENMKMMAGSQVPDTPMALWTPEHLDLHMAFLRENEAQMQPNIIQSFEAHIAAEEAYK